MDFGLHALGIGTGARRDIIDAVARGAEDRGFSTLWSGEHVVMVDEPASRYPYSADGRIAVPADADWLDPLVTLSFAAAATERIRLATGILLLPEHNPVIVAKQAASVDVLSGGRLALGIGAGWSAEEFAALGVPFEGRGRRMDEYVAAIRTIWRDDVASFTGDYVNVASIRVNPKPLRGRRIPFVIGGNTDRALKRTAATGDGWYGFNLTVEQARDRLATLTDLCREYGRPRDEIRTAAALTDATPEDVERLAASGLDEVVIVAAPPDDADELNDWLDGLNNFR